jgi:aldehyde dehydrogenase (NAD+)
MVLTKALAASRVLVHASVAPLFVEKLKSLFEAAATKLGNNPLELETDLGPVVDRQQYLRIMTYIEQGKEDASLVTGGSRKGDRGFSIRPTIFLNPAEHSPIWREEIFGPVLCVKTFETEEEAIRLANDTDYGLSSCIYTTDVTRALRLAGKLENGSVSINTPHLPSRNTPFGGKKQSGNGRELGKHGLMSYLEPKTIHIK